MFVECQNEGNLSKSGVRMCPVRVVRNGHGRYQEIAYDMPGAFAALEVISVPHGVTLITDEDGWAVDACDTLHDRINRRAGFEPRRLSGDRLFIMQRKRQCRKGGDA